MTGQYNIKLKKKFNFIKKFLTHLFFDGLHEFSAWILISGPRRKSVCFNPTGTETFASRPLYVFSANYIGIKKLSGSVRKAFFIGYFLRIP